MNLYNEIDPKAAEWLRQLISDGLIPPGTVDERSITELTPEYCNGFIQCHFFCGIGGWPLALKIAGWPEERKVWTGSAPCQPLSCAGQQKGHADERHLWPAFYRLIAKCNPPAVLGEQVASADGREWFAGIRADLEGAGFACGCANLPAGGVGAPHRRERLFFVAYANGGITGDRGIQRGGEHGLKPQDGRTSVALGDTRGRRREQPDAQERRVQQSDEAGAGGDDAMEHAEVIGRQHRERGSGGEGGSAAACGRDIEAGDRRSQGAGPMDNSIGDRRGEGRDDHRGDERVESGAAVELGAGGSGSSTGVVADGEREGLEGQQRPANLELHGGEGKERPTRKSGALGDDSMDNAAGARCDGTVEGAEGEARDEARVRLSGEGCGPGDRAMGDANGGRCGIVGFAQHGEQQRAPGHEPDRPSLDRRIERPWDTFDVIPCRDGKARRVESGTFPLVARLPGELVPSGDPSVSYAQATAEARVMRLRGYGNAIVPQAGAIFILAAEEARADILTSARSAQS